MEKILGITAEYDPFHRGHAWQIAEARRLARPDLVICAMSGDFTQRGQPALLDKWTRARIAVQQGADLVFELPFMYACSRAQRFAAGAVDLLAAAGASHICFGCEAEHPEELMELARLMAASGSRLEDMSRKLMKTGCSRVRATELACRELFGDRLADLMLMPNNILALEYLRRIRRWEETGRKIEPLPLRRFGSGYEEADPEAGYAGGMAIRRMIEMGKDVSAYLPYSAEGVSWNDLSAARQDLYRYVRSILLRSTPAQLEKIYCVGEGMEHRLLKVAREQSSYEEAVSAMVSRRYTASAIRRILVYILMNVYEMPDCDPYGRVLAANKSGRKQLRCLEDESSFSVIANGNRTDRAPEEVREALRLDSRATDMYNLICGRDVDRCSDRRQRPWMTGE